MDTRGDEATMCMCYVCMKEHMSRQRWDKKDSVVTRRHVVTLLQQERQHCNRRDSTEIREREHWYKRDSTDTREKAHVETALTPCAWLEPLAQTNSVAVCCSVLQCVAVCCSVLQCVAVCCSVLQCVAMLQCVALCCSVLQCVAVCCSVHVFNLLRRHLNPTSLASFAGKILYPNSSAALMAKWPLVQKEHFGCSIFFQNLHKFWRRWIGKKRACQARVSPDGQETSHGWASCRKCHSDLRLRSIILAVIGLTRYLYWTSSHGFSHVWCTRPYLRRVVWQWILRIVTRCSGLLCVVERCSAVWFWNLRIVKSVPTYACTRCMYI